MNRRIILTLSGLFVASLIVSILAAPAQAAGPSMTGNWELNVEKSKSTGSLPKSQTRTYEATAGQEKMTATGVDAKGGPVSISFSAGLDGKDYPYQGPNADTLAITIVDALTNSYVLKSGGKVVLTGTRTLASDGKTFTIVGKGTNAAGQAVESTLVFDRR